MAPGRPRRGNPPPTLRTRNPWAVASCIAWSVAEVLTLHGAGRSVAAAREKAASWRGRGRSLLCPPQAVARSSSTLYRRVRLALLTVHALPTIARERNWRQCRLHFPRSVFLFCIFLCLFVDTQVCVVDTHILPLVVAFDFVYVEGTTGGVGGRSYRHNVRKTWFSGPPKPPFSLPFHGKNYILELFGSRS